MARVAGLQITVDIKWRPQKKCENHNTPLAAIFVMRVRCFPFRYAGRNGALTTCHGDIFITVNFKAQY